VSIFCYTPLIAPGPVLSRRVCHIFRSATAPGERPTVRDVRLPRSPSWLIAPGSSGTASTNLSRSVVDHLRWESIGPD
jgi:hypothetical protein